MKKSNFIRVFIKKWPFYVEYGDIYPQERKNEIERCSNFEVRNQKFFAWKLLEESCKNLGYEFEKLNFHKENGKWKCDEFCFSISHCDNLIAVVLSDLNIGVDIEKADHERFAKFPANKLLAEDERTIVQQSGEIFNKLWTVKEAIFKLGDYEVFNPRKINTQATPFLTRTLLVDNKKFYLSVAGKDLSNIVYVVGEDVSVEE